MENTFNVLYTYLKHLYLVLTCLLLLFTKFCNINNVDKSKNPGLLRNKPKKELGLIKAKIGLYWTDALDFWFWVHWAQKEWAAISHFLFAKANNNGDGPDDVVVLLGFISGFAVASSVEISGYGHWHKVQLWVLKAVFSEIRRQDMRSKLFPAKNQGSILIGRPARSANQTPGTWQEKAWTHVLTRVSDKSVFRYPIHHYCIGSIDLLWHYK